MDGILRWRRNIATSEKSLYSLRCLHCHQITQELTGEGQATPSLHRSRSIRQRQTVLGGKGSDLSVLEDRNRRIEGRRRIESSVSIERASDAKLEGFGMRFGGAVFMEISDRYPWESLGAEPLIQLGLGLCHF